MHTARLLACCAAAGAAGLSVAADCRAKSGNVLPQKFSEGLRYGDGLGGFSGAVTFRRALINLGDCQRGSDHARWNAIEGPPGGSAAEQRRADDFGAAASGGSLSVWRG
jgi:hypothetical protein